MGAPKKTKSRSRIKLPPKKKRSPEEEAAIAFGPDPVPGVTQEQEDEVRELASQAGVQRAVFTADDIEAQLNAVDELMIQGSRARQIARVLNQRWPTLSLQVIESRMQAVREQRRTERREELEELRHEARERIHNLRRWALTQTPIDAETVLRCESQLAKLDGLYMPKKVDVTAQHEHRHQHALVAVMASLGDDEVSRMLEEQREQEALAAAARRMLPQPELETRVSKTG